MEVEINCFFFAVSLARGKQGGMSAEERFTAASKGQTQRRFFVVMHMSGSKSLPKKMEKTRPFTTLCLTKNDVVGWKVDKGGLVEAARNALRGARGGSTKWPG